MAGDTRGWNFDMNHISSTYTQTELEELAVLDAWGLLDGEDLAQFEAAFSNLGPTERARLRNVQVACTAHAARDIPAAPAELRATVLQRIQAVQDLDQMSLEAQRDQQSPPRPEAPPRTHFVAVSVWRMAALVLLAVSVTLIVMNRETTSQYDRLLEEHTLVSAFHTLESNMSPDDQASFIAMLRRPDIRHAYIIANNKHGFIRIAIDEQSGEVFVLAMDLSGRSTPCQLELMTAEGNVQVLTPLRTDRPIDARRLQLSDVALLDGATFRLIDGNGNVIGSTLA